VSSVTSDDVERSRSRSTGGYGLSICRRVMEAHGGSIAVERQADRGTSFVLTFPKALVTKSA
jgi:signal transduction histidine kinase